MQSSTMPVGGVHIHVWLHHAGFVVLFMLKWVRHFSTQTLQLAVGLVLLFADIMPV